MKLYHLTVPVNTNAGDCLLSHSIRALFDKEWGPQEWKVAPVRQLMSANAIQTINKEFDAVILGGGGLFLKDTAPNNNSGWQWNCPIPVLNELHKPLALFGVGYNRFRNQEDFAPIFKNHINLTAQKSCFMGLRNNGSVKSLQPYLTSSHEKLCFQPCATTLCKELYGVTEKGAWESGEKTLGITVAFDRSNLRFGALEKHCLSQLSSAMRWAAKNGWEVIIVNQHDADMKHSWLKEQSKIYRVVNTCYSSPMDIVKKYNEIALLIGMRGHCELIPFGVNNAFISLISHNKLKYFLDDIGHPEWGVEITYSNLSVWLQQTITWMHNERNLVQEQLNQAKDKLWETTRGNLDQLKQCFSNNT